MPPTPKPSAANTPIVPDAIYRPGRHRVLTEFLARPRIYATPSLHDLWESPARTNLQWESATLAT